VIAPRTVGLFPDPHTGHEGILHDYAYPGSRTKIVWQEEDRRTFRCDWLPCPDPVCILPARHSGTHAA
jgi:hypothetical protein